MSTVNNGPQIIRSGLVLNLDASLVGSYPAIAVYKVECYSSFSGGLRSANYSVQYSDDNSTWTTAFSGVMSNDSTCGIITGTNRNDSNYGKHRYWRYVEGAAIVGHHPRVSRIDFITKSGARYNLGTYAADNCSDTGAYIIGTQTKDFGGTAWLDVSGNNKTGTLTNGPVYSSSNKGIIIFDGVNDYATGFGSSIVPTSTAAYTVSVWCYRNANNSGFRELLAQWTNANSGNSFYFGFDNGNVRFTDSWNSIVVAGAGNANVWMNLVGVYDVTNAYIYLNGVLAATKGSGFTYTGTGPFIIGRQGELNGEYFDGRIANVLIYNRPLSALEVMSNFQTDKTRFGL